jgi:endoglucanase
MDERQLNFLRDLTNASGPSGYEGPVRAVWRQAAGEFAADIYGDVLGSLTAVVHPEGSPRIMLAGHLDEIGLMVTNIDDHGFLNFAPIGGHDAAILVGQRVRVLTATGPVLGVLGRKPIHLMQDDERKEPVDIKTLWIDIGASSGQEAQEVVRIGDPVTFAAGLKRLRGDLLVAKAFDNRVGAYVVAEVARALAGEAIDAAVFAVAASQEEIGYRGAIVSAERIKPDVAIAVDVGFALDHPEVEAERKRRGPMALGKGPQISRGANINPLVFDLLVQTSKEDGIPFQVDPAPAATGTDAWAIQVAHQGVATGVVSVPLRYMHTPVEVLHSRDLDQTVALLAGFIRRITRQTSFVQA